MSCSLTQHHSPLLSDQGFLSTHHRYIQAGNCSAVHPEAALYRDWNKRRIYARGAEPQTLTQGYPDAELRDCIYQEGLTDRFYFGQPKSSSIPAVAVKQEHVGGCSQPTDLFTVGAHCLWETPAEKIHTCFWQIQKPNGRDKELQHQADRGGVTEYNGSRCKERK